MSMKNWMVIVAMVALPATGAWALASEQDTLAAVEAFTTGKDAALKQNWDAAIPALEKAVTLNPDLFVANYYLGYAYLAKQDKVKGIAALQTFLAKAEADPGSADLVARATRQLGLVYANDKNFAEAVPVLEKAAKANEKDADVAFWLAVALTATKQDDAAEARWLKVSELDPKKTIALYHAGRIAYQKKDDANAKARLDAYVAQVTEGAQAGWAFFWLGQIAQRAGDNPAAKEYFKKYLATNPPAGPQVDAVRQFVQSVEAAPAAP
jgi:tetratricopeptide (TPR) repeat protein